jgi:hypothetical protein
VLRCQAALARVAGVTENVLEPEFLRNLLNRRYGGLAALKGIGRKLFCKNGGTVASNLISVVELRKGRAR